MHAESSDLSWSFRWDRDQVTEIALSFDLERHEWQQRSRHDGAGWTDPVVVDLPVPGDEDEARRIVEEFAGG